MENNVGMLIVGSYPQEYIDTFNGSILAFDTSRGVLQKGNKKVHAIHLQLDTYKPLTPNIPTKLLNHGGEAGSALVNTRSFTIWSNDRSLREITQKFLSPLSLALIFVSSGGGCGNGVFEPMIDMIRSFKLAARLMFLHVVDPVVNAEKQWCRIRSLRSKGTQDEIHYIAKNSETIKGIINTMSVDDFDIIKEVMVNINAKNKEGVIL